MSGKSWNEIISGLDNPHLLQTRQWAEVKEQYGWTAHYMLWYQGDGLLNMHYSNSTEFSHPLVRAAAMVLVRKALPGLSVMYVPKGPLFKDRDDLEIVIKVLNDLKQFAKDSGVIQLKIDPDIILGWGIPGEDTELANTSGLALRDHLKATGWKFSFEQIQYRNTVLVDLHPEEDEILGQMKSKTRYNIRLASRKGITVREGTHLDLDLLYDMYVPTSIRGRFAIRGREYYHTVWQAFLSDKQDLSFEPSAQPLVAEFEGQPVAGAVIFKFGGRAYYLHGMSLAEHSNKMAPHLIQWEAIKWAKKAGCEQYDMWGAPDHFDKTDPMWGVFRFKRGFEGNVIRSIGAWDYAPNPFLYYIYKMIMPILLGIMRWIGNRRTKKG
jgi:lipid II:glycine glycyltransferase (peptidoglycan interpeptide bridge formation enzyme)